MKYKNLFNLNNKVSVVTGACGMLGKEFSTALAEYGSKVAIIDLNKNDVDKLASQLTKKFNINCIGIKCDVSKENQVKKMVDTVEKKLGTIDVLLNNAATKSKSLNQYFKPLEKYSLKTWKDLMLAI